MSIIFSENLHCVIDFFVSIICITRLLFLFDISFNNLCFYWSFRFVIWICLEICGELFVIFIQIITNFGISKFYA